MISWQNASMEYAKQQQELEAKARAAAGRG